MKTFNFLFPFKFSYMFYFTLGLVILQFIYGCLWLHSGNNSVTTSGHTSDGIAGSEIAFLPLCGEEVLDSTKFDYEQLLKGSPCPQSRCLLMKYTKENLVQCMDDISLRSDDAAESNDSHNNKLGKEFTFVGDSRMRDQFFNFLKMLPDFARAWNGPIDGTAFHEPVRITIPLLNNVTVSFHWVVSIDQMLNLLRRWVPNLSDPNYPRPLVLLLGSFAHHTSKWSNDHRIYERELTQLVPILLKMKSKGIRIIWLNQYPFDDSVFPKNNSVNFLLSTNKAHRYNDIARHIFKNYSDNAISVWDSGDPLVQEYIRSCMILSRNAGPPPERTWVKCFDFIHSKYVVHSQTIQILFNYVCNGIYDKGLRRRRHYKQAQT